ncbi:hypothetical protein CC86DRAFT_115296 [Ophiobolus disseminans]|uniref:Uncharacterized protein n=1 Tax=Ophiobolus disseminans TaxID=1469910 RepID=A0A6A6ZJU1_9PLEO|nr:hypothetical protein CC86DRAFT_115296 [Ophiobolus disseminans]
MNVLMESEIDNSPSPPPSPTLSNAEVITPPPTPAYPPLRSALKGSRPPLSPEIEPAKPQTSFAETVVIFSHHMHPPTPNGHAPIEELHNQHTDAELARKNNWLWRPSPLYRPFTWASPDGFEKADTSYHKISWPMRERMLERDHGEDSGMRGRDDVKPTPRLK